jgi:hypothetical protein
MSKAKKINLRCGRKREKGTGRIKAGIVRDPSTSSG